ncbi:hypothetical protein HU200_038599 [Digitaria exilis]|uniref:F-box domain-containing protein n=1 Tax=Digitaria exilis TaxID=1010633 RepID=A0A835EI99_9POAL|nr:hypothetical protein HU200_038599 [Digitaria exilis]
MSEAARPPRRRPRSPLQSVTVDLSELRYLVLPSAWRDWAGLTPELISCILHGLDPVQIMLGADKVCRSWRRAVREEPELWRRIRMRRHKALLDRSLVDLDQMAIDAVERSQGQCQEFRGEGAGLHDDTSAASPTKAFEVVAKECPRLKHLINRHIGSLPLSCYGRGRKCIADGEAMAIAKMHELRSLQLIHNGLTNQGLVAILDKCLRLESLCISDCCNIRMTRKMKAKIKTKKLRLVDYIYMDDEEREETEHGSPNSECHTCLLYFGRDNEERYVKRYVNDTEAMVILTVRELRSLKLYRNDLTSKGLAAILEKCTHLESVDVWNCVNIVMNKALRQAKSGWIKAKKLTTKLLTDYFNDKIFNPEGLDIYLCRKIILNNCRGVFKDNAHGSKFDQIILRKKTRNYHRKTNKMKAKIERYMADRQHVGNVDYMEFDGVKFDSYRMYSPMEDHYREFNPKKYHHSYRYNCWKLDHVKFEHGYGYNYYGKLDEKVKPGSPIIECSTCLMFEYFAERWGVLDLDDYADYYDPSYGLDAHDETDFGMHDRMVGKRLRRNVFVERG